MKKYVLNGKTVIIIIFYVIIFLFSLNIQAQWLLGLKAGYSRNAIHNPNAKGFTYNRGKWGYTTGIAAEYRFLNKIALQAELSWIQKNYKSIRTRSYYTNYTNNYIELPLSVKYYFGKGQLKVYAELGGSLSYWVYAHRKGRSWNMMATEGNEHLDFSESYSFDDKKDRRFGIGLLGGVGLNYQINPKHHILLGYRQILSLTDTEKKYLGKPKRRNNTMIFSLGYMYKL